jgi:hypothetical protein
MTFFIDPQNFVILFFLLSIVNKELVADMSRTNLSADNYNRRTIPIFHMVAPSYLSMVLA